VGRYSFVLVLVAAVIPVAAASPPDDADVLRGQIAFAANPDERGALGLQLFVARADGSEVRRLTRMRGDTSPSWSPRGLYVTFARIQTPESAIFRIAASGEGLRQLTPLKLGFDSPDWAPAGGRIAAVAGNPFAKPPSADHIYVMRADGRKRRRITNTASDDMDPAWSPDGTRIAFSRDKSGTTSDHNFGELYVISADGRRIRRLTSTPLADEYGPAWSPDGTRIAFWRRDETGDSIVLINVDGTNERRLSPDPSDEQWPAWSPDGTHIAFVKDILTLKAGEIWVMNSDGSDRRKLIDGPYSDPWEPDWGP
jgi:Tol biopolymer transport system component